MPWLQSERNETEKVGTMEFVNKNREKQTEQNKTKQPELELIKVSSTEELEKGKGLSKRDK